MNEYLDDLKRDLRNDPEYAALYLESAETPAERKLESDVAEAQMVSRIRTTSESQAPLP